jgi:hypothetical protein
MTKSAGRPVRRLWRRRSPDCGIFSHARFVLLARQPGHFRGNNFFDAPSLLDCHAIAEPVETVMNAVPEPPPPMDIVDFVPDDASEVGDVTLPGLTIDAHALDQRRAPSGILFTDRPSDEHERSVYKSVKLRNLYTLHSRLPFTAPSSPQRLEGRPFLRGPPSSAHRITSTRTAMRQHHSGD